jgi:hypothetical protein
MTLKASKGVSVQKQATLCHTLSDLCNPSDSRKPSEQNPSEQNPSEQNPSLQPLGLCVYYCRT